MSVNNFDVFMIIAYFVLVLFFVCCCCYERSYCNKIKKVRPINQSLDDDDETNV